MIAVFARQSGLRRDSQFLLRNFGRDKVWKLNSQFVFSPIILSLRQDDDDGYVDAADSVCDIGIAHDGRLGSALDDLGQDQLGADPLARGGDCDRQAVSPVVVICESQ